LAGSHVLLEVRILHLIGHKLILLLLLLLLQELLLLL